MKFLRFAFLFLLATACIPFKATTKNDLFPGQAQLPQEEAPHFKNSLEWWYFTGHLKDAATGENFGVEYVFFHFSPDGKQDYQMVNFAMTDPQTQGFKYDYQLDKLAVPLTAALPINLAQPKDDQTWTLTGQEGRYQLRGRMSTKGSDNKNQTGQAINLSTTPAKPVLLHGGTGYEQYGPIAQAGYYSYPRLGDGANIVLCIKGLFIPQTILACQAL